MSLAWRVQAVSPRPWLQWLWQCDTMLLLSCAILSSMRTTPSHSLRSQRRRIEGGRRYHSARCPLQAVMKNRMRPSRMHGTCKSALQEKGVEHDKEEQHKSSPKELEKTLYRPSMASTVPINRRLTSWHLSKQSLPPSQITSPPPTPITQACP